jgi:serine-type D-Ala-D-Ala carboxypeptidase (penicillin-binding protein 5/6)
VKTLALLITLALHSTGLWARVPEPSRTSLTSTATTGRLVTQAPAKLAPVTFAPLPVHMGTDPLELKLASGYAVDVATGTVLYEKNPDDKRPIASVTKMVTALVVLSRHAPDEAVQIPTLPTYGPYDERIGLTPGETYHLGDLVRGALINSGNDAADALALIDADTTPKFATHMNAKMTEWGINNTRFSSPSGLQDAANYASAESLAKIGALALTNPFIRETVGQSQATITSTAGRTLNLTTTNQLLATGQFYGIKTGYTPVAGECFVGLTRIQGHEVITVVLGADSRFGATQTLANWIDHNWQWL